MWRDKKWWNKVFPDLVFAELVTEPGASQTYSQVRLPTSKFFLGKKISWLPSALIPEVSQQQFYIIY